LRYTVCGTIVASQIIRWSSPGSSVKQENDVVAIGGVAWGWSMEISSRVKIERYRYLII
jgi:hypothetical protein